MAKSENENVYFPHYINARNDRKIRRLRKELGVEGYGIFYMLLEVLREQSDLRYPIEDIDLLAEDFGTSEQKIKVVIYHYDLFMVDKDEFFYSPKQIEYLQPYFAKSKRAKHAALARWGKSDTNAMQMHSAGNANAMQAKQRRANQSKAERDDQPTKPLPLSAIPIEQRTTRINQILSDSKLSESQKELYLLKIESNGYQKKQGGKMTDITEANLKADAEFNLKQGWLNATNQNNGFSTAPGGYWNE